MIYIYKIIIHLVENPGLDILYSPRTKTTVKPKFCNQAAAWIRRARSSSFFHNGPKLYNSIPGHLRELEDIGQPSKSNVYRFKHRLNMLLKDILDVPGTLANSLCPTIL